MRPRSRSPLASRRASLLAPLLALLAALTLLATPTHASTPHLCKCTCFSTNTTIVPIYRALDPANPCTTCTRQFCLDQGLQGCAGARIQPPNKDTGTGWEGDVWAKCFRRDSGKDQVVVSLYVLTIVGLLVAAGMRAHIAVWVEEYQTGGTPALIRAVKASIPRELPFGLGGGGRSGRGGSIGLQGRR